MERTEYKLKIGVSCPLNKQAVQFYHSAKQQFVEADLASYQLRGPHAGIIELD